MSLWNCLESRSSGSQKPLFRDCAILRTLQTANPQSWLVHRGHGFDVGLTNEGHGFVVKVGEAASSRLRVDDVCGLTSEYLPTSATENRCPGLRRLAGLRVPFAGECCKLRDHTMAGQDPLRDIQSFLSCWAAGVNIA